MLQSIRDRTQGWITGVIVFLVCAAFALWGIHSYLEASGQPDIAAKVNKQSIQQADLSAAYSRLRQQQQMQLGADFVMDQKVEAQLKKQALDQLVMGQVLVQAAMKEGYRISMGQVYGALLMIPAFQVDGHFSRERFNEMISGNLYNEKTFLADMQMTLLTNQMRSGFVESAFALPAEVAIAVKLINQKRDVGYMIIPATLFDKDIKITDAEAKAYYDQHSVQFMMPERVSIAYIILSMSQFAGQQQAERMFADANDKLSNLTFANPDSLDVAAKALGLEIKTTDFFDRQGGKDALTTNPKVVTAAFSADVLHGNNSNVIDLNPDTLLVLRMKEHQAAAVQPFETVKDKVVAILKQQVAQQRAQALGAQMLAQLKAGKSGQQLAQNAKLTWRVVSGVTRFGTQAPTALINAAFRMPRPANTTASVGGVRLPNGDYAVLSLLAVHDGDIKQLADSQKHIYQEELENSDGQLDYALYVRGLVNKAKITINNTK